MSEYLSKMFDLEVGVVSVRVDVDVWFDSQGAYGENSVEEKGSGHIFIDDPDGGSKGVWFNNFEEAESWLRRNGIDEDLLQKTMEDGYFNKD